jgi:AAA domain
MSLLQRKTSGVEVMSHCLIIFGTEAVGKSGFAASFPKPFFIDIEGGSKNYNVDRITDLSWGEILNVLEELKTTDYKTVVIDSLDWLESLLHKSICEKQKVSTIEDSFGSYGKWVSGVLQEWKPFIQLLKELRSLGKNIIMTSHYQIKVFNDPSTALPYDRFTLKLTDKVGAMFKEWVDCVLFANFETFSSSTDVKAKKGKGISTGARKLYCEKRAAYDAKNRFGLPESINLDYEEFIRLATVVKVDLQKEIESLLLDISDKELLEKIKVTMIGADDNKLNQIKNRILVILQEK